ncbi:hypothetical protein [Caldimonas sp. KR1-144]|uniref:hypothetical protein n=1 Tax=Caldimonas sp. KR1-144 TaxID=3400911 RepID=UPI003C087F9C
MSRDPKLQKLSRLAVLFSMAALAACGGSDNDTAEPGNAPPPAEETPTPPPAAEFTLELSSDKALVIQGHSVTLTATLTRKNGFAGAVLVELQGLPAGVAAQPVSIAEGATTAEITLSAPLTAAHSLPTAATARGSSGNLVATRGLTVTVGGEPGVLDTSFGTGKVFTSVAEGEDFAYGMAVQPDGKVISVGSTSTTAGGADFAIARHERDGTLDASFGSGGKLATAIAAGGGSDEAQAVALQADGKIVVAGYATGATTDLDFALVRYNADGTLDAGFGTGGKVTTDIGGSTDRIGAIAIQADGKIVVAGSSYSGPVTGVDFALARYNADGTLDATFGNGGKVVTPMKNFTGTDVVYSLLLQMVDGEQRIVAAGGDGDFLIARYTAAGALDASFANGGKIVGLFGSVGGGAYAMARGGANTIVVAGHAESDVALVRLDENGALEPSFGNGGKVVTPLSASNWDAATAIVRQADGKFVVGGWVYEGGSSSANFAAVRYTATGVLDTTFGSGGIVVTPMAGASRSDSGRALVLQADERVPTVRALQAGEANEGGGFQFALMRYWL